jgi:hypothetical protein
MTLGPRFRRVGALDRRFVNREKAIAAFNDQLNAVNDEPRVLNVIGVGGIGKSRLLRELGRRAEDRELPTAVLDLQVSALRQQEDALAVLRTQLGRQGVRFARFDIAYAVLWQRLHPNLDLHQADLPFRAESEILTHILDDASGVPVFGTALGLVKLADRAKRRNRRRRLISDDETLARIDELPTAEVLDAVTYLFAEDLRVSSKDRPYVVFVDAYEALVPPVLRTAGQMASADFWLRDLAAQLDRGVVVIASREPLSWQKYHPEWGRLIRPCRIHGLPMAARLELLSGGPIADQAKLRAVAEASEGLPFYLHLAVDTREHSAVHGDQVVSSNEILQRFLQHVEAGEVRSLELLSVARVFDYEIFRSLTREFDIPGDKIRWESLISYSFVYPAEGEWRLHQLMATALRKRLTEPVRNDAHIVLRRLWDQRATDGVRASTASGGRALREAVYHGVWAGDVSAESFLDYADRAMRGGGKQTADGMATDLDQYLAEQPDDELAEAARCVKAETAVLMGDAKRAVELTPDECELQFDRVAGARLAIARAHARRIAGATADATRIYSAAWERHRSGARRVAGLWMADLHMCQGRFSTAVALVDEVLASCPPDEPELRGDLTRLLHLGYRFHLNFDDAARTLEQARSYYRQAASAIGLANIDTNHAELLAWTDPEKVLSRAAGIISAQQELGALHELGKTHTALAIALFRNKRPAEAAESFEISCDYLERARYRSGRARAELFRGFLHARNGNTDSAVKSITWAVSELVTTQVYPTLILLAERALSQLGQESAEISSAAAAARQALQPLDSIASLEQRIAELANGLLEEGE